MPKDSIPLSASATFADSLRPPMSSGPITAARTNARVARDGDIALPAEAGMSSVMLSVVNAAKDSERSAVSDAGRKYDGAKEPLAQGFWQYFGKAAKGIALISKYGAEKYKVAYADQNWRKVDNAKGRYADALLRHLEAHLRGEVLDPESGKPHVDHMAWNALALSELEKQ